MYISIYLSIYIYIYGNLPAGHCLHCDIDDAPLIFEYVPTYYIQLNDIYYISIVVQYSIVLYSIVYYGIISKSLIYYTLEMYML
jgi:hypothetical protein